MRLMARCFIVLLLFGSFCIPLLSYGNIEFSDNFDDNSINSALWTYYHHSGPTANETNQHLEITFPTTSSGNDFVAGYSSVCKLHGDFDIEISYALLTWPTMNGVRVGLTTEFAAVERASFGQNDQYGAPRESFTFDPGGPRWRDATGNTDGKLRMTRVGSIATGYAYEEGQWISLGVVTTNGQDTAYNLHAWSHDYAFADQDVRVAFDNFVVNQGHLVCPESQVDTDKDGLLDVWETSGKGLDVNQDGIIDLDLYSLGARPDQKDIFVEIDYMAGQKPNQEALSDVIAAFKASPIDQPKGINLHLMVDDQVPTINNILFRNDGSGLLDSFNDIKLGGNNPNLTDITRLCGLSTTAHFGSDSDRHHANCANILKAKQKVFRYSLFAHSLGEGGLKTTGVAEVGGNDFLISLGNWDSIEGFFRYGFKQGRRLVEAGTFMHELGHTLGLLHGGDQDDQYGIADDAYNCKPNYLSVMNYTYQTPFADPNRPLDYSRLELPPLDETNLDEPRGIMGPATRKVLFGADGVIYRTIHQLIKYLPTADKPIDWNGDGDTDDTHTSADINYVNIFYATGTLISICGTTPAQTDLRGYNDWANIDFDFKDSINYADGQRLDIRSEITTDQLVALALGVDADGDGIANGLDTCPAQDLGCFAYSIYIAIVGK